jgi:hypothetical protein
MNREGAVAEPQKSYLKRDTSKEPWSPQGAKNEVTCLGGNQIH